MKLKINKACDLASISVLPPRRTCGSSGGGMSASASAAAGAVASQQQQRSQTMSQQSSSQGGGGGGCASFSQGGGASFSQGAGGGGASFSQGGGGGGSASFSQGGGGGGASLLHSQSQLSQASLDENLLTLHLPSPARDQRFGLHDDSSKRMPSLPASSASCVREESQLQLAKISSNPIHRWNPSLPDSRCQVPNEDVERKFQHLASSVHKMGMVLDSVQNDVMQLNRAMKEASLDSGSIRQKVVLLENSLQQILKGQDDLKAILEGGTKSNPEQLSVLNSHTSKLNEISSTLSVLPKQVQADLRQLKGDIFRIFTKEMEGIVRAIKSFSDRTAVIQMLGDQSCTTNGKPLMNQTPVANGRPQMKQTPVANGRPQMNQTPIANVRPQMNQTPITNGRSQMNQIPEANGRPVMSKIPLPKVLPAPLVHQRKVDGLKPKVEQGMVKAGAQKLVGSSYSRLAPKVDPHLPAKKAPVSIIIDSDDDSDGRASCIILKTETGAADLMNQATSEEALQILRRARKRRRREMQAVVLV